MLDGMLLARVGIVAEAFSFALIAPQIIPAKTLKQVEDALGRNIERLSLISDIRNTRSLTFLPKLTYFLTAILIVLLALGYLSLWRIDSWKLDVVVLSILSMYAMSLPLLYRLGFLFTPREEDFTNEWPALARYLTLAFLSPLLFLIALASVVAEQLEKGLRSTAYAATRRSIEGNRLRIHLFWAGVVIFIGGMSAQFVGTWFGG